MLGEVERPVRLGTTVHGGLAPSIFALVERGVLKRPERAAIVKGKVLLRFRDGFRPVSMVFADEIEVSDTVVRGPDLTVTASLADVVLLTTAPLRMGMPSPVNDRGRSVLGKMATGQIRLWGDIKLARAMLELMRIDVPTARSRVEPEPEPLPEVWVDRLT